MRAVSGEWRSIVDKLEKAIHQYSRDLQWYEEGRLDKRPMLGSELSGNHELVCYLDESAYHKYSLG